MVRWDVLRQRVLNVLDDTNRDKPTWTDEELLAFINTSLVNISDHTPQQKEWTITPVDATRTIELPSDIVALGPVAIILDVQELLLTPQRRDVGEFFQTTGSGLYPESFYEWPKGTLKFFSDFPAHTTLRVQYLGCWDEVERAESYLRVPRWMEEALQWHVTMQALSKPGVLAAQLGQYKTKLDSGNPTDNPVLEYAKWCQKQYDRVLANHPAFSPDDWGRANA